MPRLKNHQCAACSHTSVEQAQQRECWQGQLCHSRRSYYRHRHTRNSDRRLNAFGKTAPLQLKNL